jgi:protein-S-isoprenylcysteine O-methyltransferase Ste14
MEEKKEFPRIWDYMCGWMFGGLTTSIIATMIWWKAILLNLFIFILIGVLLILLKITYEEKQRRKRFGVK